MLNIPEEQIFTLYEYENLKEELTFKDVVFNIVYDIKQYLGISIDINKIKEIINLDILDKYLDYLSNFLNPIINKCIDILDTIEIYNKFSFKYINNIPNQFNNEEHSKLLDVFLNTLLENEYINDEYKSFI